MMAPDFEQRQPEFHFTENFHRAQVQPANQAHNAEYPDPPCDLRKPKAHIDTERGDVGQTDDDCSKSVSPAEDKTGHRP